MNIEQRKSEPRDAVFVPNGRTKGQIFYNPLRPSGRVAFSVAHEISHSFFPNTINGARFRDITAPDSREANELERLCDLAASELLMPIEEFRAEAHSFFSLARSEELAAKFGSSFEATVFRLATAHPGLAVAGLLKYRRRMDEERKLMASTQQLLFNDLGGKNCGVPSPKYRRQSFFASNNCGDEHTIRWNKSFDTSSCVYLAPESHGICSAVEALPNSAREQGVLEVIRAPFQREDAHPEFPDLMFLWTSES